MTSLKAELHGEQNKVVSISLCRLSAPHTSNIDLYRRLSQSSFHAGGIINESKTFGQAYLRKVQDNQEKRQGNGYLRKSQAQAASGLT